jgi:hypothetical protein
MLHGFSTAQFLTGLVLVGVLWYGGVYLFFYLKKNGGRSGTGLSGESGTLGLADKGSGNRLSDDISLDAPGDDMMGKAGLPEGMSIVGVDQIGFVDLDKDADKVDQLGLIPDLLEEIKSVFMVLAKEDGSKRDFVNLMKVVKETYPGMASHPRIRVINDFIADHASFHISKEELENLWY